MNDKPVFSCFKGPDGPCLKITTPDSHAWILLPDAAVVEVEAMAKKLNAALDEPAPKATLPA